MNNVKKIIWTNELSNGNSTIDDAHKKLLEIFSDLTELIEYKKDRQEFAKILTKMTDYSFIHLKMEKEYMEELSFTMLAQYKNSHRNYIYNVAMYNVNLLSTNPPDPADIIAFLENWWTNHIFNHENKHEQ